MNGIKNEEYIKKMIMSMTEVQRLNQLSAAQNMLVILRNLHASDLTFVYMLFQPKTVRDITTVCRDILNLGDHELTSKELAEFNTYLQDLDVYTEGKRTKRKKATEFKNAKG